MYNVYIIKKANEIKLITYNTLNPLLVDQVKLDLILNAFHIPYVLANDYLLSKQSNESSYTIETYQSNIESALEAGSIVLNLKENGIPTPSKPKLKRKAK